MSGMDRMKARTQGHMVVAAQLGDVLGVREGGGKTAAYAPHVGDGASPGSSPKIHSKDANG